MFLHLLMWIFELFILIKMTYSFKILKHDLLYFYKTHDSIYLTDPSNHSTSYGIYVAGETKIIDIPKNVANISQIVDWQVVNTDVDRLMFVHRNKPYILLNRRHIQEMKYSGQLNGSIIAFGDNEALHVPTILNPNYIEPSYKWNYIELLSFDAENKIVSVTHSLPWLANDDWFYIQEWRMTDYSHFDNKLYLLIKRTIRNGTSSSGIQEISVMRMCLDKGSDLISTAVEIYFTNNLPKDKILDLKFIYLFKSSNNEDLQFLLHSSQATTDNFLYFIIYEIGDLLTLLREISIRSPNIFLMRQHLRSELSQCKSYVDINCSTGINAVPLRNVTDFVILHLTIENTGPLVSHEIQSVTLPTPFYSSDLFLHMKNSNGWLSCMSIDRQLYCDDLTVAARPNKYHVNKNPFGYFWVVENNLIVYQKSNKKLCSLLTDCFDCIMYGIHSLNCIWLNEKCTSTNQSLNLADQITDKCFKILYFHPLKLNVSSTTINVQLDRTLNLSDPDKYILIEADSANSCTINEINGTNISCSLNLIKAGIFYVKVHLINDKYSDTSMVSAKSTQQIEITPPDSSVFAFIILMMLFLVLLVLEFLIIFMIYLKVGKKDRSNRSRFRSFRSVSYTTDFTQVDNKTRDLSQLSSSGIGLRTKSTISMNTLPGTNNRVTSISSVS